MERMYKDFKDIADFYIVYLREAHAADSMRAVGYAKDKKILQPRDYAERCEVAERLVKEKKLTIPFLIDDMSNTAAQAYQALPDRAFLVRMDGTVGVAGEKGPRGFAPALREIKEWLEEYKKLGKEPEIKTPRERKPTSQPSRRKRRGVKP